MNQMTEDDKYALKELLRGFGTTAGVFVAIIVILVVIINVSSGGEPVKPTAEVVDTYKGCDIVRWNAHGFAEYKYFLHCNNTRPVYEQ